MNTVQNSQNLSLNADNFEEKIVRGGETLSAFEMRSYVDKLDEYIDDINSSVDSIINSVADVLKDNRYSLDGYIELKDLLESDNVSKDDISDLISLAKDYKNKDEKISSIYKIKNELSDCLYGLRDASRVLEKRRDMFDTMCPEEFMEKFPSKDFKVPAKLGLDSESQRFSDIIYNISVIQLTIGSEFGKIKTPELLEDIQKQDLSPINSNTDNIIDLTSNRSSLKM